MAMAKRGSRRISVDGVLYRWRMAPNDGHMLLVVETLDHCRCQLTACFAYHDATQSTTAPDDRLFQRRKVSPEVVRRIIVTAVNRGWQPSLSGLSPFQIHDAESLVPLDEID